VASNISACADELNLAQLRAVWQGPVQISLDEDDLRRVRSSREIVDDALNREQPVYGINTGFGLLANVRIADDELAQLQKNLILSHCVGVGDPLDDRVVRLALVLKVLGLGQGFSGVTPQLINSLCALLNHEVYPCIPARGSVGASGDLAPLAHMSAILLGVGSARHAGSELPAGEVLTVAGLVPLKLQPKEGLALINGTQISTALALGALLEAEQIFSAACVAGALSLDAARGSDTPFDVRISRVRGHAGQQDVAALYRRLLAGSQIRDSHTDCNRVQDPYCLRCQPQVMGACLDAMRHVSTVLLTEAKAVTDNPLVFSDTGEILSGGNFHAEPVALACDHLALAIAETGAISERRIALLIDPHMSGGLPPFLVENSGLNSGFMITQVTAAALASENKSLAHPASVDSLPTSANQEDHVSMATTAALRLYQMLDNVAGIVAIELLAACQGIEFHRPLQSSATLEGVFAEVREMSERYVDDRPLAGDIARVRDAIQDGRFLEHAHALLPSAD